MSNLLATEYAGEIVKMREELSKFKGKSIEEITAIFYIAEEIKKRWEADASDPSIIVGVDDILTKTAFLKGYLK